MLTEHGSSGEVKYRSEFGGFWVDANDAQSRIDQKLESGEITWKEAEQLRHWVERGWIVLEQAVDPALCDRINDEISSAWSKGDSPLVVSDSLTHEVRSLDSTSPLENVRLVDAYVHLDSARDALFADPVIRFLRLVFDVEPMLFQSLSFQRGSGQGIHQDTAYVVTDEPMKLAASWIALQDVSEGSGELMYYDRSHTLPEYKFSGTSKHWNPERDGDEQHTEWSDLLHKHAAEMGLPLATFLPKKGDVFIWSADLAHGGKPIADPEATRRSLVGHYTASGVTPHFFNYLPDHRASRAVPGRGTYVSQYYRLDLLDGATGAPAPPSATSEKEAPPQPVEPRRRGLLSRLRQRASR